MYLMAQNIQINFGSCHPTAKPPGGVTSIRKILVKMRNKVKHVCVPSSVPSLETNYTNWLVNKYAKSTSHYDQPQQSSAFVPHQGGSWKYCIRLAYVVVEVPKTSLFLQIIAQELQLLKLLINTAEGNFLLIIRCWVTSCTHLKCLTFSFSLKSSGLLSILQNLTVHWFSAVTGFRTEESTKHSRQVECVILQMITTAP